MRGQILATARRILSEEGVEALSIRRITKDMNYSVGIVYHYFENKEQILACVLREGYQRILSALKPPGDDLSPEEALRASFEEYIEAMLGWSSEYLALMTSASPQILAFTSVLGEGMCEARPALALLSRTLETGISQGRFAPCDPQLTAQALWSAAFGLLMRLAVEKDVSPEQRAKLMRRQMDIILKGLQP